jgi:hypothetical protein
MSNEPEFKSTVVSGHGEIGIVHHPSQYGCQPHAVGRAGGAIIYCSRKLFL